MKRGELIEKLKNTQPANAKTLHKLGEIIRKEFDRTNDEDKAFELLHLAWIYQIPQLDEMLTDYSISDFKWF